MKTNHLIQYDCVSQDSSRAWNPAEFDPAKGDYVAETELQFSATAPQAGQSIEFEGDPGTRWIITDVSTYPSDNPNGTQAYHLATCTQV